ncbi:MAG TPA: YfhO family protein [Firmicutes bacterium]|nr:YfhO family protein [Bacillota bacterium]
MNQKANARSNLLRTIVMAVIFLSLTCLFYLVFQSDKQLTHTAQKILYPLGFGGLLAGLIVLLFSVYLEEGAPRARGRWFYPAMAGLLGFACMGLSYMYLGVWPVGDRSVMVVDMHHQYAPLLAQLRDMILHGGSALYSFDVGLGGSFLPLFAYYLSSPFNLLLVAFPESMLNEGILVVTLLKNALTAFCFAACVQYVYSRRDPSVVAVSILYSMMMYLIAYSWDIMWLDCVMILPIVVMSFEKLMRTGRYLPYVLSLAYALYANYYIGFMLCLFLVLYFIVYWVRRPRSAEERARCFGRFSIGSLLGGGLTMFLLLPTFLSLAHTSAAGGELRELTSNFAMFDLLGRHLYESTPTIRSGNLPNIYCGLLAVVLLPIFATLRSIPLRRRLAYLGLVAVMAFSLVLNQPDLIWHGLHAPNDLPYRFSFLYSFVLLLIAFETLGHLREIRFRQVGGTLLGLLAYLMLAERFKTLAEPAKSGEYSFISIYASLLFAALYAGVLLLGTRRRAARTAYCGLLLVVTIEMVTNGGATFKTLNANEYFTARKDYVANDITQALHTAVDRAEEIGDQAADGAFYRLEFLPRRTTVDTALYDYHGMTVFASSNPQSVTKFMNYLGYANNGVNSYLYRSFVPAADSLFGLKYVILSSRLGSHPQLTLLEQSGTAENPYYIYENAAALPVGFLVEDSIKDWNPTQYNPIRSQNNLYSCMTGDAEELYTMATLAADLTGTGSVGSSTGSSFSMSVSGGQSSASFEATVAETGQVFVYVDCGAAESISVSGGGNTWSSSPSEPYIIDAGTLSEGDVVTVTVTSEMSCSGNIYVATLRDEVFERQLAALQESPLVVTESGDTRLYGTVNAAKDGVLFTSIPYDAGWTVKVDGRQVDTFAAGDAMLAFDLEAGEHTVEITFFTVGLLPGIVISVVSLVLLVLLLWFIQKTVRPKDPTDDEFRAFGRLFSSPARRAAEPWSGGAGVALSDVASPVLPGEAAPEPAPPEEAGPAEEGPDGERDTNGGKEGPDSDNHSDAGL